MDKNNKILPPLPSNPHLEACRISLVCFHHQHVVTLVQGHVFIYKDVCDISLTGLPALSSVVSLAREAFLRHGQVVSLSSFKPSVTSCCEQRDSWTSSSNLQSLPRGGFSFSSFISLRSFFFSSSLFFLLSLLWLFWPLLNSFPVFTFLDLIHGSGLPCGWQDLPFLGTLEGPLCFFLTVLSKYPVVIHCPEWYVPVTRGCSLKSVLMSHSSLSYAHYLVRSS